MAERFGCEAEEARPHLWLGTDVDLDGDQLDERLFIFPQRRLDGDQPIDLHLVFDDNSAITLTLTGTGLSAVAKHSSVSFEEVHPIGLDHSVLALTSQYQDGQQHTVLVDIADCTPRVLATLQTGTGTGTCFGPINDEGRQVIRRWRWAEADTSAVDEVVAFHSDGTENTMPADTRVCGPFVAPDELTGPGTELQGIHRILVGEANPPAEILVRFRAQGGNHYFVDRFAGPDDNPIDLGGPATMLYDARVTDSYDWGVALTPGLVWATNGGPELSNLHELIYLRGSETTCSEHRSTRTTSNDGGATFSTTICDFPLTLAIEEIFD